MDLKIDTSKPKVMDGENEVDICELYINVKKKKTPTD